MDNRWPAKGIASRSRLPDTGIRIRQVACAGNSDWRCRTMNWMNIPTRITRSELFLGASEEQAGVWLKLLAYCCEQENNGYIHGSDKWTDREWSHSTGLTKALVHAPSRLWKFNSAGSLVLHAYPEDHQTAVATMRAAGRAGAKKRWARKQHGKNGSQDAHPNSPPNGHPNRVSNTHPNA